MKILHPNVPLIGICVCLMMSSSSLMVATAALVGAALTTNPALATLPMAAQFIATMLTSIPAGLLMEKIGRKPAFLFSAAFGVVGGGIAGLSIVNQSFWGFVLGAVCIGIFNGFGNFYRFAAADSVEVAYKSKAISYVMIGGVLAAVLGPNLAKHSRLWIGEAEFAASYFSIIVLYVLVFIVMTFVRMEKRPAPSRREKKSGVVTKLGSAQEVASNTEELIKGRSLREIALQPKYIVGLVCGMFGFGVMSFVMTATPLAMSHHGFLFSDTSVVIQWHVLAMFVPAFFTGSLIANFGVLRIMTLGVFLGLVCVAINLLGTGFSHFLVALICLGLSWSFLFVGATTLITETYREEEKNKAQSFNDFVVFSVVAMASLSAGALQSRFGWQAINIGAIPFLLIILASLAWLSSKSDKAYSKA